MRSWKLQPQGPRKQINPQSCLSFCPLSALHQKSHIDNMLPLARLEGEQISSAIYVYLFISATLREKRSPSRRKDSDEDTIGFQIMLLARIEGAPLSKAYK